MASFATAAELATLSRRTFTASDTAAASLALELVTGTIQDSLGQYISFVEDDVVEIRGNWTPYLTLPQRPVIDVSEVSLSTPYSSTLEVASTAYRWTRDGKVTMSYSPANWPTADDDLGGGNWGGPDSTVTVTYSHGYVAIPPGIRNVCLRAAKRLMDNPNALGSESLGGYYSYSVSGGADPAEILSEAEERKIRRAYRKQTA